MDKDRVKGAVDDAVGRAKRQVGEWTGDTRTQAEGAAQQIKGKTEKVVGASQGRSPRRPYRRRSRTRAGRAGS